MVHPLTLAPSGLGTRQSTNASRLASSRHLAQSKMNIQTQKEILLSRGWTVECLRSRIADCRKGLREAHARGGSALYSYRLLYCTWATNYRRMIAVLTS